MPCLRVILLAGLALPALSAAALAQARPAASATPAARPAAMAIPITFARSGRRTEIRLLPFLGGRERIEKEVVLTAFGRVWAGPADVVQTSALTRTAMTVPSARVPIVFSIVDRRKRIVGELVAYPDRDVEWDKKITLYSCGAPGWFSRWASAVGLPVKRIPVAELASAKLTPADEKGKSLLILGGPAAGKDLPDVAKLANGKEGNVLVLAADWFGDAAGDVNVRPRQMLAGLSEIAKQHWPVPMKFSSHCRPWPGITNRWGWIVGENGLPLVEEVRPLSPGQLHVLPAGDPPTYEKEPQVDRTPRMLLSYIPWPEQLGRSESADASFLSLLSAAATAKPRQCRWHPVRFVNGPWPESEGCVCPVLLAVRSGGFWKRQDLPDAKPVYAGPIYLILDLRGRGKGPATGEMSLSEHCRRELQGAPAINLVILGDDRMLDEWEWLKLDRAKKTIHRPGVVWLSNDELPPSRDNRIRLMLKLTALGVPLGTSNNKE